MVFHDPPLGGGGGFNITGGIGDLGGGGGGGGTKSTGFGGDVNLMIQLVLDLEERLGISGQLRDALAAQDVTITLGAYLLLLIPLYEATRLDSPRDPPSGIMLPTRLAVDPQMASEAVGSVAKLLNEAASDPAAFDVDLAEQRSSGGKVGRIITSLSIIKSYWKKFCDIPPFCGETK